MLECSAPGGKLLKTYNIENYPAIRTMAGADLAYSMFEQSNFCQDISHWNVDRVKTRRHCFVLSNMPYDGEYEPKVKVPNEWWK